MNWTVHHGDCRDVMAAMEPSSVHAIVTDPPYGLSFMGRGWDRGVPGVEFWQAALRVAKPGAHLVAFGGTRTHHRLMVAIEDAGWEIRDCLMFLYGSGFPKSLNVYAQATKQAAERDVRFVRAGHVSPPVYSCRECGQVLLSCVPEQGASALWTAPVAGHEGLEEPGMEGRRHVQTAQGQLWECSVCSMSHGVLADGETGRLRDGAPACGGADSRPLSLANRGCPPYRSQAAEQRPGEPDAVFIERRAQEFRGAGTSLKPAYEPIVLARKPLAGTVAANVNAHGAGALNVADCRVGSTRGAPASHSRTRSSFGPPPEGRDPSELDPNAGRWPANVALGCACEVEHDPDCAVALLDAQSGETGGGPPGWTGATTANAYGQYANRSPIHHADTGGASRFFYTAKATRSEREAGLEHRTRRKVNDGRQAAHDTAYQRAETQRANTHPTVKPVDLMRWLVRLVGGKRGSLVLDPFCGSGTTGIACALEGFAFAGIELDAEHCEIARARIVAAHEQAGTLSASDLQHVEDRQGPAQLGLYADKESA